MGLNLSEEKVVEMLFDMHREIGEIKKGQDDFREATEKKLNELDKRLEDGNRTFKDIKEQCKERGESSAKLQANVMSNTERISNIEDTGVPKRTSQKIDSGLGLSIVNFLLTVFKHFFP